MSFKRYCISVLTIIVVIAAISPAAFAQSGDEAVTRSMFEQFIWPGGGIIGMILIAMNIAAWALIVEQLLSIRRSKLCPQALEGELTAMIDKQKFREAIELTAVEPSLLSTVVHASLSAAPSGFVSMQRAMGEAIEQRATSLLRRVEILNILGNIAPMLGLMGTVLGMILAFNQIVEDGGTPDAGRLADAIGMALVTTFWGLVVAVPSLAAYSVLRNRIDSLSADTAVAAEELLARFAPTAREPE